MEDDCTPAKSDEISNLNQIIAHKDLEILNLKKRFNLRQKTIADHVNLEDKVRRSKEQTKTLKKDMKEKSEYFEMKIKEKDNHLGTLQEEQKNKMTV